MATCGYNNAMELGIRELKNNLSHYVRQVEGGKRISVTAHGRVVAELVPPATRTTKKRSRAKLSRYEQLVAEGVIRPAIEEGDPLEGDELPALLAPGEGLAILDWLRGDK